MSDVLLSRIKQGYLLPGESLQWSLVRKELPGHRFGLVIKSVEEKWGGDAALHVLDPNANNAAVWISRKETWSRARAVAGSGYLTVMNLFDRNVGVNTFDLQPSSEAILLAYGDVHSFINFGPKTLVVRDSGFPAFAPEDEQSTVVDTSTQLDLVKMLREK